MNKILVQGSVLILLLSLMLFSCNDDELEVGLEILPDSDQLILNADTISVECFTYKGLLGAANGTESNSISYPIGHVYDPVFGETSSEIVMGFAFNTSDFYSHDTIHPEDKALSLKLYMNITDLVGDEIVDLDLYGDAEGFDIDAFLLNNAVSYSGSTDRNIASDLYDVNDSRSILTNHSTYINSTDIAQLDSGYTYLVVELDDELANTFMDSIYLNGDIYDIMPAILLQARRRTGTDGGLQSFMPDSSNTKILLAYTRPDTVGVIDTLYSSLDMRRFRCIYRNNHTYRNAEIEPVFGDTLNQSDRFYIQGLGGTRGILKVNSLIDFKSKTQDSIGVNLAELVIPINKDYLDDTLKYALPERIVARGIPNTSQVVSISDELFPGYYSNGYLDESNWEYRINVTEYVNEYLLSKTDYLLLSLSNAMLFGSSSNGVTTFNYDYSTPSRVVLNTGHEGIEDKAYIRIIYTKIRD